MKLYVSPGACSLADHIALHEAGIPFETVKVDLKTKRTQTGEDYLQINPKGQVPALQFDDGDILTENVAVLTWISEGGRPPPQEETLKDKIARFRLLEVLAFIAAELHKSFRSFFGPGASDADRQAGGEAIARRLDYMAGQLQGDYLFGAAPTVADDYLFVMLTWAEKNDLALPPPFLAFMDRMKARPAVRRALAEEDPAA